MSTPMREVELKARVDDMDAARRSVERAGAVLIFEGRMSDRIYDTPQRSLAAQDNVLRVRHHISDLAVTGQLDWKGPTSREDGFKVRAELTTGVSSPDALASMLDRLGYEVVAELDRDVAEYQLEHQLANGGHTSVAIRFERYPRMDTLVEVEGSPAGIEYAIVALGMPRDSFTADRLADFIRAYELRTGQTAAICSRDLERL
jgi:predicted adenylyl cyclase CyaB